MSAPASAWRAALLVACTALVPHPGYAFAPELPLGARQTVERDSELDSFDAPVGRFANGVLPSVTIEGAISRRAWRIGTAGMTPLQIIVPLRDQIEAAGYEVIFECSARTCGGFDFRFATEVLPGPNMYVNLARFRYLTAFSGPRDAPDGAIGILVSATSASSYVQIITAGTGPQAEALLPETAVVAPGDAAPEPVPLPVTGEALLEQGHMVLEDLIFATGSTDLGDGEYTSLADLAAIMTEQPGMRIALVGHTDTVGGLEPNIALSRARARSVRQRLISGYGIDPGRMEAEGMGYLAPMASNLTEEGRRRNRRVEAIVLSVE
ncbi:OmpA family protein [uncultured Roseobacter sp.]|uniref:OmpA family protein n=1 Tax=uncultured Roseobacter sp. TaxID=114847 RepID=UPI002633C642|nr:OmpA family protein [uncultured Roseobacter sp.]